MDNGWTETKARVETWTPSGDQIVLQGVRAFSIPATGQIVIYPQDVMRREMEVMAESHGLEHRDMPFMLMVYAKPGPFQEGYIHMLYRMNKMLFYQWKGMEEDGFGQAMPHDEFVAEKKGPVPKCLKEDLRRLEESGFITVTWPSGRGRQSISFNLTTKGEAVAHDLWVRADPRLKEITLHWKEKLFLKDPRTIMRDVHRDFPEYKKGYTEPDED
jgi:hypothetical protein